MSRVGRRWQDLKGCPATPSSHSLYNTRLFLQHAGLLDAISSQPGELLRFGDCGTQGEGLAPEQLSAHLQREVGPVSGLVCEAGGSNLVVDLEGQLRAAGRPYVIVYAGQPEQVTPDFETSMRLGGKRGGKRGGGGEDGRVKRRRAMPGSLTR